MVPAGAVKAPEIVRFLNELVEAPLMAVVPLKVTVPLLWVNVPLLAQLPATFMLAADGPVNAPEMVRLLKDVVDEPLMVDVPLKVTVPLLFVNVPLLTQLPATFMLAADGAVKVPEMLR